MSDRLPYAHGTEADIAWREDGRSGDPPIVLVHSLGLDGEMWAPQVSRLASERHVIRVDIRGHGASSAPAGPYAIADLADDILRVVDAVGLRRVDLAGLSIGGHIALWLAIHRPERVGDLVLAGTAARIGTPETWQDRIELVSRVGLAGIRDAVLSRWFLPGFQGTAPDVHAWAAERLVTTPVAGYVGCCGALASSDLRADVGRVRARTLVLVGEDDRATPPDDARWLRQHIGGSRLEVIQGAAHIANLEAPAVFGSLLEDFLAGSMR
jgi:3-oxoadipate enol-lactonase